MDPGFTLPDTVQCGLCKNNIVQNYCDFCHVNLCKLCIGEHISNDYDKHKVVPFQERKSSLIFPTCKLHSNKTSHLQCKSCDALLCVLCIASDEHKGHDFIVLEDIYKTKKECIEKDTREIKKAIAPTYEEIRNELFDKIANLDGEYEAIIKVISEQGEKWHTEVDTVIIKMKNEITWIKKKHRNLLERHLNEIKYIEYLLRENLSALKELEESNVVAAIVEYRSRINEFNKLPPKVQVTLPTFDPKQIIGDQFYEMFGSLKPFFSTIDKDGYKMKFPEGSKVIHTFNTGYRELRSISFYKKGKIWTSARIGDIKCFSNGGKCRKTITTKSKEPPSDITVKSGGELVYCDINSKTLNEMKDGQIEEIIRFKGWKPSNLCVTSIGDFLVTLYNDDMTQSKIIRYSGSSEKQTIQFDNGGKPLYSVNSKIKYITENRNHDICVADHGASAVVVVNQYGKLRWRQTGHFSGDTKKSFEPYGITTNSQSQILTADCDNHYILILDQNGQFLRYIEDVKNPYSVCVDNLDNLYVAEYLTGNVKVIKYLK
uniref:B box-type domain-containing protein n=2 Tax=Magallana gigas TaxID=29159 RepID=A0A8W8LTI6_MAGGI|nr:uncharacterized protein LOC109619031 [Crassostrea gigas]